MARDLADKSLRDVLAAFAAVVPTPGGGSACAAASAIGVALLMKAASVAGVAHALTGIETQLIDAIDDDAAAYRDVVAARKQPRDSEAAHALRTAATQQALRHATDVPLTIMRLSTGALAEARSLAPRINRSTVADVRVAILLLRAGFEGARTTVDANLGALADSEHATSISDECRRLSATAGLSSREAEGLLGFG